MIRDLNTENIKIYKKVGILHSETGKIGVHAWNIKGCFPYNIKCSHKLIHKINNLRDK